MSKRTSELVYLDKNDKELEHDLKLCLELKFGYEDGIKEAINKKVDIFEFEGSKCTILEGLVQLKEYQDYIDEITEELTLRKKEVKRKLQFDAV